MNKILGTFKKARVLLPVVHCINPEQADRAVNIAMENGADGVFLINQGGMNVATLLQRAMSAARGGVWTGVNLLGLDPYEAAVEIRSEEADPSTIRGIWVDSARVDLDDPRRTTSWAAMMTAMRHGWEALYFGGVAFKGQQHVPDEHLAYVAQLAVNANVDVITTSGPATGSPPTVEKVSTMRDAIGDHALAIASGITPENVSLFLPYVDAFLVATGIESSFGVFDPGRVRALADTIHVDAGTR